VAPARDRASAALAPGSAPPSFPQLPFPAEGGPFVARPAPTRTAVLAAFEQATRPARASAPITAPAGAAIPARPAGALAAAASAPAPVPAPAPIASPLMRPVTLARATGDGAEKGADEGREPARRSDPAPAAPDLDAFADYVLERLRHELRDGRERLGFLLDDAR
jgi:hypothetical protein